MNHGVPKLDDVRIAVVGMGYVGLPLAVALSEYFPTIGYDTFAKRVQQLSDGCDITGEIESAELAQCKQLSFCADIEKLRSCNVFFIAVPTPVNEEKRPDLQPLLLATGQIGAIMRAGAVIVFESTVYPGATEYDCVPILEQSSGLKFNQQFYCGYSPERINPGDKKRRLADIVKVTSGSTEEAAEFVDAIYRKIIKAGTHKAPSIQVAEAAKAVENTQRDINIALANELAMMFSRMGVDTEAVLKAAETKWNFMPVRPGLVGGHCIGVDPYYLIHKSQLAGHQPELILTARKINEGMSQHVFTQILQLMAKRRINVAESRVLIMGLTFKENCSDVRNTRVVEIVQALRECHADVEVMDPWVDKDDALNLLGKALIAEPQQAHYDAIVIAVGHREFVSIGTDKIREWLKPNGLLFDVKYVLEKDGVDGRL